MIHVIDDAIRAINEGKETRDFKDGRQGNQRL